MLRVCALRFLSARAPLSCRVPLCARAAYSLSLTLQCGGTCAAARCGSSAAAAASASSSGSAAAPGAVRVCVCVRVRGFERRSGHEPLLTHARLRAFGLSVRAQRVERARLRAPRAELQSLAVCGVVSTSQHRYGVPDCFQPLQWHQLGPVTRVDGLSEPADAAHPVNTAAPLGTAPPLPFSCSHLTIANHLYILYPLEVAQGR